MSVVFRTKIDHVLDNLTPAWQDEIIIVTRGTDAEHEAEMHAVLKKLEDHGYKATTMKSKFFQQHTEWCGYLIDENRVRPKHSRTEAVQKIGIPTTVREIRTILGSVQYLAKFIKNLSAKKEPIRQLLRKQVKLNWGHSQQAAFDQIESDIANIATLKHYDPNAPTTLSTDASPKRTRSHPVANGRKRKTASGIRIKLPKPNGAKVRHK